MFVRRLDRVPDHPVIRRMELTGYPDEPPRTCNFCDECGEEIYEGETYYQIQGLVLCGSCVEDAKMEATIED